MAPNIIGSLSGLFNSLTLRKKQDLIVYINLPAIGFTRVFTRGFCSWPRRITSDGAYGVRLLTLSRESCWRPMTWRWQTWKLPTAGVRTISGGIDPTDSLSRPAIELFNGLINDALARSAKVTHTERLQRQSFHNEPTITQACIPIHHPFEVKGFLKHCRAVFSDRSFKLACLTFVARGGCDNDLADWGVQRR